MNNQNPIEKRTVLNRWTMVLLLGLLVFIEADADEVPIGRLDAFAKKMHQASLSAMGYPINQNTGLEAFYKWYSGSRLYEVSLNNAGDPRQDSVSALHTHEFENEVIDFFAPLYGFPLKDAWGFVTNSGTDGNMHGMYFGVKQLLSETHLPPICYVSGEAHYSIRRVADLQNIEVRLIKTDAEGRMIVDELEKALDPKRPALIVLSMGTTFKGAIDDQAAIAAVIGRKKPIAVYRHIDAALFGGYLPFTDQKALVDRGVVTFDSIAVSGHKFFGFDEPMGIFLTTKATMSRTNPFKVSYLNEAVPTITCSRNAVSTLKFWWKVKQVGMDGFRKQAASILETAKYLKEQLSSLGQTAWRNDYSNTVYFRRPGNAVMTKYELAPDHDVRLGGDLAHIVVMQHITNKVVDQFIADLRPAMKSTR